MRLTVAAVGRLKAGPERELAGRYLERAGKLGRGIGLHPTEIIEIDEVAPAGRRSGSRKRAPR